MQNTNKLFLSMVIVVTVTVFFAGTAMAQAQSATPASPTGAEMATQNSNAGLLPTSPFYFLDTWSETLGNMFTFGAAKKAKRMNRLSKERMAELSQLAADQSEKAKSKLNKTAERYRNTIDSAIENIEKARENRGEEGDPELDEIATEISSSTVGHQIGLARAYEQVSSDEARQVIEQAMQNSARNHQRASQTIYGQGGEQEQARQRIQEQREKVEQKMNELRGRGVPVPDFAGPGPRQGTGTPEGRSGGPDERVSGQGASSGMPQECGQDVVEARQSAEGQVCTQQVMRMRCPENEGVVYMARNGCIISSLKSMGWTEAEVTPTQNGQGGPNTPVENNGNQSAQTPAETPNSGGQGGPPQLQ